MSRVAPGHPAVATKLDERNPSGSATEPARVDRLDYEAFALVPELANAASF